MHRDQLVQKWDKYRFKRILKMQNDEVKKFFNLDGCGLEIEFGVHYERRCRSYIETGLSKMKSLVGDNGKFVPDMTIGQDLNVEIVLVPLMKEPLQILFCEIRNVIDFYENFVFDANCGVHANFRADEKLKRAFFHVLINGGYDSTRFIHSKYKVDFMDIVCKPSGRMMTYDNYIDFQNRISGKYAGVNFLKNNLVEFRTLDLDWDNIAYVYDLYEYAQQFSDEHTVVDLYPYQEEAV